MLASQAWKRLGLGARLRRGSFARGILLVCGGTGLGQIVAFAVSPVIARLYEPAQFGVLGVFISMVGVVHLAASLRYEAALPIAEDDAEAANLLVLTLAVGAAVCTVGGLVLLWLGPGLMAGTRMAVAIPYLWLVPFGVLWVAAYQAFTLMAVRRQDYAGISRTKVTQNVAMAFVQVLGGLLRAGPLGLMVGYLGGQGGGIALLAQRAVRANPAAYRQVTLAGIRRAAVRYRRFPQMSAPALLLDSAVNHFPLLMLAGVYGVEVMGWINLTQRTMVGPLGLLADSVRQVYYGEIAAARVRGEKRLLPLLLRRARQLALGGLALIVGVNVLAPLVVGVLFGPKWSQVPLVLALLSPMVYAGFVVSPLGSTVEVLERQDLHLLRELGRALCTGSVIWAVLAFRPPWTTALGMVSAAAVVNYAWYFTLAYLAIKQHRGFQAPGPSDLANTPRS